jgi:hypothetical protein
MDHAEALERLDAAFVGPGKLRSIAADQSPEGRELRRHIRACPDCAVELRALELTGLALAAAAPDSLRAPVLARARVLAAVIALGVARGSAAALPVPVPALVPPLAPSSLPPAALLAAPLAVPNAIPPTEPLGAPLAAPRRSGRPWPLSVTLSGLLRLGAAAAAAVILFVAGGVAGGPLGITAPPQGAVDMVALVSASDRILEQPGHLRLTLDRSNGQPGGSILLDPASRQIVVVSEALAPATDLRYSCYLLRGGQRTWLGPMFYWSGTTYWAGTVRAVSDLGRRGDVLEVRIQGTTDTPPLSGAF